MGRSGGGGERLSRRIPKILRVRRERQMVSHDSNFRDGSPKNRSPKSIAKNLSPLMRGELSVGACSGGKAWGRTLTRMWGLQSARRSIFHVAMKLPGLR
jgi:hypothetical protein